MLSQLNTQGWIAAIFVSIVACVLCYYVLHWLVLHLPGHKLALFEGVHGISATTFGIIIFGEAFNMGMIAGGTLILAGLIVACWPKNEERAESVITENSIQ